MFFWWASSRDEVLGTGAFACPECRCKRAYQYIRTPNWECIRCYACRIEFALSVLEKGVQDPGPILPASWKFQTDPGAGHDCQVVQLSNVAAEEVRRRIVAGGFSPAIAVRITPHASGNGCEVQFDYPYSDGHDLIGNSQNLIVLVAREHAAQLMGRLIDYSAGQFRISL